MFKKSTNKKFALSAVASAIASCCFAQYSPPAYSPQGAMQQAVPVQYAQQQYAPQQYAQPTVQTMAMQPGYAAQPQLQTYAPQQPMYDQAMYQQMQPNYGYTGGGFAGGVREVIQKALQTNPDVRARWNAFKASIEDVSVARGDLFPNLDYSGQIDRATSKSKTYTDTNINDSTDGTTTESSTTNWGKKWHKTIYALTLSQSIFEGFATVSLISQYGKEKLAKYLDFLGTSEDVAQQAGEAYYDVIRRRKLLGLAEDYFVLHRAIFDQINQRTTQGIANRVDLDQAASRLALSDYSLTVEQANLHDVSARYQRIIGELPSPNIMDSGGLQIGLPPSEYSAVQTAFTSSPLLRAAVERVAASGYQIDGARSAFYPKLSFQGKLQQDRDNAPSVSGTTGTQVLKNTANSLGFYASWNLFNGFSDMARMRKFEYERDSVLDQRERACRDLRQNVSINYNSSAKSREGLNVTRNQVATLERARDAYRDQYNIGKRSLLDLLNTEKELFDARSTLVNTEADYNISILKLQSSMGQLLQQVGMMKQPGQDGVPEIREFEQGLGDICPPISPMIEGNSRVELENRARALVGQRTAAPAAPVTPYVPSAPAATNAQSFNLAADALFDLGSATLKPKGISEVNALADRIRGQQVSSISVTGHTDRLGSASSNMSLSQRRAESVKTQMVSRGVSSSLITTQGMGQNSPVTGGKCDSLGKSSRNRALVDCLQADRRVDIQVR